MTPEEISFELFKIKKQLNMSQIARSLNPPVTTTAIIRVVSGESVSLRIMDAIAKALKKDVKYVFANYFFNKEKPAN